MKNLITLFLSIFLLNFPVFAESQNSYLQPQSYESQRQVLQGSKYENNTPPNAGRYNDSFKKYEYNYDKQRNSGNYYDSYKRQNDNYNKYRY